MFLLLGSDQEWQHFGRFPKSTTGGFQITKDIPTLSGKSARLRKKKRETLKTTSGKASVTWKLCSGRSTSMILKVIRVRLLPWVVFLEVLNGPSSLQKRNATLNMDLNSPLLPFGAYLRNKFFSFNHPWRFTPLLATIHSAPRWTKGLVAFVLLFEAFNF